MPAPSKITEKPGAQKDRHSIACKPLLGERSRTSRDPSGQEGAAALAAGPLAPVPFNFAQVSILSSGTVVLAKSNVNRIGGPDEQEADQVMRQVMQRLDAQPAPRPQGGDGATSRSGGRRRGAGGPAPIQRQVRPSALPSGGEIPGQVAAGIEQARGGGQALGQYHPPADGGGIRRRLQRRPRALCPVQVRVRRAQEPDPRRDLVRQEARQRVVAELSGTRSQNCKRHPDRIASARRAGSGSSRLVPPPCADVTPSYRLWLCERTDLRSSAPGGDYRVTRRRGSGRRSEDQDATPASDR